MGYPEISEKMSEIDGFPQKIIIKVGMAASFCN